jgi:biopolymer transport protein ExbB/TolQ
MKQRIIQAVLRLYHSPENARGRSPLDLPERAVWVNFVIALIICVVVGNLFVRGLYWRASLSLNKGAADITLSEKSVTIESLTAELTKLSLPKKLPEELNLGVLFTQNKVTYAAFGNWMEGQNNIAPGQLRTAILGQLDGWFFPVANFPATKDIMSGFRFEKPDPSTLRSLKPEDWNYYLAASCIDQFRKNLTGGYHHPLRLAQAMAGGIQWLTFLLAIWGGLMLFWRFAFTSLQRRLVQTGTIPLPELDSSNLWNIEQSDPENPPMFFRLQKQFPGLFLPAELVAQSIQSGAIDHPPHQMQEYIGDKVAEAKAKVESAEFELIDFVVYACPTLGFLGTIVGITDAFSKAALIISSNNPIDRMAAFDEVTKALALAFDTSFVGLLAVLILNQMLSLLKRREAHLFLQMEKETFTQLRRWQQKQQLKRAFDHA